MVYPVTVRPGDRTPDKSRRPASGRRRQETDVSYQDLGPVERRTARPASKGRRRRLLPGVLLTVLVLVAVGASATVATLHVRSTRSEIAARRPPDTAVVFVLEGLRAEDLHLAGLPAISALAKQGVSYSSAWVGQLGGPSPSAPATIATGLYPREHGIVGTEWRDAQTHALISAIDPAQVRVGLIDQILESHNVAPLAGAVKARYPSSHVLAVGGAGCAAASAAGTWTADYVLCPIRNKGLWRPGAVAGHAAPVGLLDGPGWTVRVAHGSALAPTVEGWRLGQQDDWVARVAVQVMRNTATRLTIVSFPELGMLLRWTPAGQRGALIRQVMAGIDRDIGKVVGEIRRERKYNRTVFVLTSDGGTTPALTHVPLSRIDEAILASGGEKIYLNADGLAMIGVRDHLEAAPVAGALQSERLRQVDAIYYKDKSSAGWVYRPQYLNPGLPPTFADATAYLLWTITSSSAPDDSVIFAPGAIAGTPRLGRLPATGVASGAQWANQHVPLIIAGHGVLAGAQSRYPARLVDIAPTLETLLKLGRPKGDGVTLADAVVTPSHGDQAQQQRAARWLTPLVQVLRERATQAAG